LKADDRQAQIIKASESPKSWRVSENIKGREKKVKFRIIEDEIFNVEKADIHHPRLPLASIAN
jgi:hypothetical protein